MPYLLVVVPGKEQEMRIARIAAAVLVEAPGLVILTTTATRLADQGSLAAIWYQVTTKERSSGMVARTQFYHGSKVI